MPTKRQVLEQLKRDELIAAVERFELPVADRRVRDLLIEALASSRKATLAEILGELKRARLKELCRALGLDDGGREKALIIARLGGSGSGTPRADMAGGPAARGLGATGGLPASVCLRRTGGQATSGTRASARIILASPLPDFASSAPPTHPAG